MEVCSARRGPRRSGAVAAAAVGTLAATALAAGLLTASPAAAVGAYTSAVVVAPVAPPGNLLADADGVAVSPDGSTGYVLDGASSASSRILTVTSAGVVTATTTLTGVSGAQGIALGGSTLFVADTDHHRVVSLPVPTATATVTPTLVAGSTPAGGAPVPGTAGSSPLKNPSGVAWDSTGSGALYVADTGNNQVEKVVGGTAAGALSVVAGTGSSSPGAQSPGVATLSRLNAPQDVAVDGSGALWIADTGNDAVAKVAGTTLSTAFTVNRPASLATDGTTVFAGSGATVVAAPVGGGAASTAVSGLTSAAGLAVTSTGTAWVADANGAASRVLTLTQAGTDAAPQITSPAPTTATKGVALSRTFTASGFPTPTWSVVGAAPASVTGLAIGATSGVLTGTPTASGAVTFTVRASNTIGGTARHDDQQVTLLVGSTPAVVARPTAVAGQGTATLTWAAPAASTATGEAVTGYVVTSYAGAAAGTAKTVSASTLTTTLTGLRAGTSCTFTVAATNGFGAAAASPASAAVTPYGGITEPAAGLTRFEGGNRVMTAVRTSQQLFPDAGSARAVVLASSTSFADSLAGARLASAVGAPLLLTDPAALNPEVATEVARVLAVPAATTAATTTTLAAADAVSTAKPTTTGTVYLLGGTSAVSAAVETAVKAVGAKYSVTRLSGADRYETAVKIADQVAVDDPVSGAPLYVASGRDYPDGLAVAALAARTGGPVLLTDGPTMPAATLAYLQTHDPNSELLVAVGGPAAKATTGHGGERALVGVDRYDTARLVAARFTAQPGSVRVRDVGLATGQNWPDALAGAAAMGNLDGPLLLTPSTSLSPAVGSALTAVSRAGKPSAALVFGGPSVVAPGTADAFAALVAG